eukprot:jgi/Botrbrau1/6437/Bobra.0034s0013.1
MAVGSVVKGLEPASLWRYFEDITKIPRPSKHEERILQYLKDFAQQHGLKWRQDEVGNIVIYRPGSGGGEDALPVIIQRDVSYEYGACTGACGHGDGKDSDSDHDFLKDPCDSTSHMMASGSRPREPTLGADNGIGTRNGPDGGPSAWTAPFLRGGQCLIWTQKTGGSCLLAVRAAETPLLYLDAEFEPAPTKGFTALELRISGLMGGHSGLNIHEGRGNAVQLAARAVDRLLHTIPAARLVSIQGGDKRNAIAREATAELLVPREFASEARLAVENIAHALREEYWRAGGRELQSESKLLTLLRALPHGVIKFSHHVPGLVETSTNLASVKFDKVTDKGAQYTIQCNTRSSLMDAIENTREVIRRLATLCGAEVEMDIAYPGWNPNPHSKVLQLAKEVVSKILGREPKVGAIHAGLECGIIGEKVAGVDTVSLGPTIRGAHSPDEEGGDRHRSSLLEGRLGHSIPPGRHQGP